MGFRLLNDVRVGFFFLNVGNNISENGIYSFCKTPLLSLLNGDNPSKLHINQR